MHRILANAVVGLSLVANIACTQPVQIGKCSDKKIEIRNSYRWAKCEVNAHNCDASDDGRVGCCCDAGFEVNDDGHCTPCCFKECASVVVEIPQSFRWVKCEANMHQCDASGDGKNGCCCNAGYTANDDDDCMLCCPSLNSSSSFTVPRKCLAAMAVGAVGSVVAAPAALALAGFTGAGITSGSIAALWQSSMAGVTGGSFFATLQSVAMSGLGTAGAVSLSGSTAAGALAFCKGVDQLCNGCIGE